MVRSKVLFFGGATLNHAICALAALAFAALFAWIVWLIVDVEMPFIAGPWHNR